MHFKNIIIITLNFKVKYLLSIYSYEYEKKN